MSKLAVAVSAELVPEYGSNLCGIMSPQSPLARDRSTGLLSARFLTLAALASRRLKLAHAGVGHHRIHIGPPAPRCSRGAQRTVCSTRSSRATWHQRLQPHSGQNSWLQPFVC